MEIPKGGLGSELPVSTGGGGGGITEETFASHVKTASLPLLCDPGGSQFPTNFGSIPFDEDSPQIPPVNNPGIEPINFDGMNFVAGVYPATFWNLPEGGLYVAHCIVEGVWETVDQPSHKGTFDIHLSYQNSNMQNGLWEQTLYWDSSLQIDSVAPFFDITTAPFWIEADLPWNYPTTYSIMAASFAQQPDGAGTELFDILGARIEFVRLAPLPTP